MSTNLAPIVLFVYNRPEHTRKTLQAISNNVLANDSTLYIYCDGVADNASKELKNNNKLVKKLLIQKYNDEFSFKAVVQRLSKIVNE